MLQKLRVGLIGTGRVANAHIAALQATNEVKIVALWNRTKSRAVDIAKKHQLQDAIIYDDWQALIREARLDAVDVVSAPQLRAAPICMALDKGIHVLVEKPFALNIRDADEMLSAAGKSQCVTAICFTWRYKSSILVARRLIQSGVIGELRHYESIWRMSLPSIIDPSGRMYLTEAQGGLGLVGDNGCHQFDTMKFLTSETATHIASYLFWVKPNEFDLRTNFAHHILGRNDKEVGIYFEHTVPPGPGFKEFKRRIYVEGDKGYIEIEGRMADDGKVTMRLEKESSPRIILPESVEQSVLPQHKGLISDFVSTIRNPDSKAKPTNLPSFEDGLRSLEIAIASLRADREHEWVAISGLR